jgi:hypothetical protein
MPGDWELSRTNPLAELAPLIDEMAKRGYLDAFLVRHHTPEVESHAEGAARRLISKIARKLGVDARDVIISEAESVSSVVASQLVETTQKLVHPEPVQAFLDQLMGKHRVIPRATVNDVLSAGRKLGALKRKPRVMLSIEEGIEAEAVEELPAPVVEEETADPPPLPEEWLAAITTMRRKGMKMTLANLAETLDISDRYLRKIRAPAKK